MVVYIYPKKGKPVEAFTYTTRAKDGSPLFCKKLDTAFKKAAKLFKVTERELVYETF